MIITHQPVDLLDRYSFSKLDLLESHTGAIKPPGMWGSKLNGSNMERYPLCPFTIKVFGDGVHFNGQRPSLKRAVESVAVIDHWTGLTTDALIKHSITKIQAPDLRAEASALL